MNKSRISKRCKLMMMEASKASGIDLLEMWFEMIDCCCAWLGRVSSTRPAGLSLAVSAEQIPEKSRHK